MTDTFAPSARPPRTAIAWATKTELFVEIPSRDGGPPYIIRYAKTEAGLAAALNIICETPAPAPPKPSPARRPLPNFTASQREAAANILRKMKITG